MVFIFLRAVVNIPKQTLIKTVISHDDYLAAGAWATCQYRHYSELSISRFSSPNTGRSHHVFVVNNCWQEMNKIYEEVGRLWVKLWKLLMLILTRSEYLYKAKWNVIWRICGIFSPWWPVWNKYVIDYCTRALTISSCFKPTKNNSSNHFSNIVIPLSRLVKFIDHFN